MHFLRLCSALLRAYTNIWVIMRISFINRKTINICRHSHIAPAGMNGTRASTLNLPTAWQEGASIVICSIHARVVNFAVREATRGIFPNTLARFSPDEVCVCTVVHARLELHEHVAVLELAVHRLREFGEHFSNFSLVFQGTDFLNRVIIFCFRRYDTTLAKNS